MPRIWDEQEKRDDEARSGRPVHDMRDEQDDDAPRGRAPWTETLHAPLVSWDRFFWFALLCALLLSGGAAYNRLHIEWSHRTAGIVVDYRDVVSLAGQAGADPVAVYRQMAERGTVGITVSELTGKDLAAGLMPLTYGSLASFPASVRTGIGARLDRAAILADSSEPTLPLMMEYLKIRMPAASRHAVGKQTLIVLPYAVDELADSGLLPDFGAFSFAGRVGTSVLYRPYPASGVDGQRTADCLKWLKGKYPALACVVPAGQIVAGYPELGPMARVLLDERIPVGQAEFVRQIGISSLYAAVRPNIIPLHSLVRDELISRRMTREQVVERMVRAVHERSIRLILLRPYDLYSVGKLPFFLEDMQRIQGALQSRGYRLGWPATLPLVGSSLPAALGVAVVLLLMLCSYAKRYVGRDGGYLTRLEGAFLAAVALVLGFAMWRLPAVSRGVGGLAAAFIATEATLWALDRYRKPFAGLLAGLLIVLAGGIPIAAFYGTTSAMLRLAPFSGVKLTLLLPPLLILANDLKRRVHPESFADILRRPPLWGELILVGVLMLGALLLTVRSGNVSYVPGWEVRFRDMLERVLWVRPRTKEFLVGYPCLVLYYALVGRGWAVRYREVFRIGASLAFASAVNTFCHFHTLMPLTLVRVVNGWWLGIVVGFVALVALDYIGGPIWKRGGRELFD